MLFTIFSAGLGAGAVALAILGFLLAVMIALVLHEWAHAFAAYKSGDPTAKMMGRMTINPAKHVEPLGLLMFMTVGIGWAKPVPVNPFNYRNFRWGNFWVSVSGVIVNLILGIVASICFFFVWRATGTTSLTAIASTNLGLFFPYVFFMYAMFINFALLIFNLLPIFPLDGYNMLVSFTKPNNRFMQFMRQYSQPLMIVVLLTLMFTGVVGMMLNGIVNGLISFWGLMF